MSLYHIWNPWLVEPKKLVLIVGKGDSDQIAEGTDAFIAQLLADVGVKEKPTEWSLTPIRSNYFVEDPDSDAWRDQWVIGWRAEISLPSSPKLKVPRFGTEETDAEDESWDSDSPRHHRKLKGARAYVIADFKSDAPLQKARKEIEALGKKAGVVGTTVAQVMGKFPELQVDLGERPNSFFEEGAPAAKGIVEAARKHGGMTNHHETLRALK